MNTPIHNPSVSYRWNVSEQEPITQMESGRRVTVIPREVEILTGGWCGGGVYVVLKGQRLNRDGSLGNVKAAVFSDDPTAYYGDDLGALPEWARPYLDVVRSREEVTA